ncbi:MAG TPA: hypoxanthine phosphoribosyltransferase [Mobilitalea sp.]|nr:hypoxanthine phosphoribosyltransferase [Mobilitalea sp.]
MTGKVRVMIPEEQVNQRIKEMADQISKDYEGKSVHLICILKGSVFFSCELAKRLTIPVTLDFMSVSSYGSETVSSGRVRILKDLDESIQDKNVLIVEDIIDSGRTLAYLGDLLLTRAPESLTFCTLLDKPDRRVTDVDVKYIGFEIPDEFVVGYGLDYDQYYRNLPYIGVVE